MEATTLQRNSTKLENFDATISILTGGNANYRQGVHWIIQDLGQESAFANKTLTMEVAVENARDIDLLFKKLDRVPVDKLKTPQDFAEYLKTLNDPLVLEQITGFGNEVRTLSQYGYIYETTSKMFKK